MLISILPLVGAYFVLFRHKKVKLVIVSFCIIVPFSLIAGALVAGFVFFINVNLAGFYWVYILLIYFVEFIALVLIAYLIDMIVYATSYLLRDKPLSLSEHVKIVLRELISKRGSRKIASSSTLFFILLVLVTFALFYSEEVAFVQIIAFEFSAIGIIFYFMNRGFGINLEGRTLREYQIITNLVLILIIPTVFILDFYTSRLGGLDQLLPQLDSNLVIISSIAILVVHGIKLDNNWRITGTIASLYALIFVAIACAIIGMLLTPFYLSSFSTQTLTLPNNVIISIPSQYLPTPLTLNLFFTKLSIILDYFVFGTVVFLYRNQKELSATKDSIEDSIEQGKNDKTQD